MDPLLLTILITLAKIIGLTFLVVLPLVPICVYFERRFAAVIQDRVGPNRVGIPLTLFGLKKDFSFAGLIQPMADGVKLFLKEDFTPAHVRKAFYWLAPALTIAPSLITLAVIPFGSSIEIGGQTINLAIADIDVGPLFIFSIASLSVYGITLAGWSSNSKFPFIGGVRSTAQMISYEICLGLSIVPVLLYFGDLNLGKIVQHQSEHGWLLMPFWNANGFQMPSANTLLFLIPAFISFVIFTISIFAETNRMPFDLPECETELVGGYHTEYSSMKFAMFFMGEYAAMVVGSALIITLFLGGWSAGPLDGMIAGATAFGVKIGGLLHLGVFLAKLMAFILFFILVRWTVPRFRYDQLMKLGWVIFFEAALVNVFLAALVIAAPALSAAIIGLGVVLLVALTLAIIWVAKVSEEPVRRNFGLLGQD
jgi:NADH-quinone oxidoreductase subunit H